MQKKKHIDQRIVKKSVDGHNFKFRQIKKNILLTTMNSHHFASVLIRNFSAQQGGTFRLLGIGI